MQIACPNCETAYQVDASSLGPSGRSVRCARCRTVWFAADTAALPEIAAAFRAEMVQFGATAAPVADEGPEWLMPGGGEPDQTGTDSGTDSGLDPADPRFVNDAPSIAADSTATGDPLTGYAMPSGSNVPMVESPPVAPIEHGAGATIVAEDIETVAARRAREQAGNWRFRLQWPPWPTAIVVLLLIDLGLIVWRADVVRLAPQTASLYAAIGLQVNLRGLALTNVTTETRTAEGVPVLLIQGRILSTAKRTVEVPRLRFAVRNASGNEIYTWTALPNRSLLSPGETLAFQSRLASPPPEANDVLVRFFNRHDLGIGIE
jgi:predicted Zn finger-like uncharacterized protein